VLSDVKIVVTDKGMHLMSCSQYSVALWLLFTAESDWRCFRGCAISSSLGFRGIFFPGGQIQGFLEVTLKTQVFAVTTMANAPNTLQHFQQGIAVKTFHFFEGAPVPWHNGTMASPSLVQRRRVECLV